MYETIFLKNTNKKEIVAILNHDEKIIDNNLIQIFEKLSSENTEEDSPEKADIIKKQKFSKFQTEKNNIYFSIKDNLFAGISTKETSNEKIYNDILSDILNDEKFRIKQDINNSEKLKELLEFYVSKHFINNKNNLSGNPNKNGKYLQLKNINDDQNENRNNSNINNNDDNDEENPNAKELILDLYFPDGEDEENKVNKSLVRMPTNYVNKKNCKLAFFLIFIIIGISLASVLIYILI